MAVTAAEAAWLAGIVEGEGSIARRSPKQYRNRRIRVSMTDEDVIQRCHTITGVGRVNGPYGRGLTATGAAKKPYWEWTVNNRTDFVEICCQLFPLLGARRRQQIVETLA
jgi:hypothetical protein